MNHELYHYSEQNYCTGGCFFVVFFCVVFVSHICRLIKVEKKDAAVFSVLKVFQVLSLVKEFLKILEVHRIFVICFGCASVENTLAVKIVGKCKHCTPFRLLGQWTDVLSNHFHDTLGNQKSRFWQPPKTFLTD